MAHWRTELNNIGTKHRSLVIAWDDGSTGPKNNCTWWAAAYVNGVEYGRGEGDDKATAKEEAARQAVEALRERGF